MYYLIINNGIIIHIYKIDNYIIFLVLINIILRLYIFLYIICNNFFKVFINLIKYIVILIYV